MTQVSQASSIVPRAELFAHDADTGVRGIGPTRESAFEQAAMALTMAVTDPADIVPKDAVEVTCEAPDDGILLVDWLSMISRSKVATPARIVSECPTACRP